MTARILVALDTTDVAAAMAQAHAVRGLATGVKLGLEFFNANGPAGVRQVAAAGEPVFLDLKFHDIPNTVAGAVRAVVPLRPFMLTIHVAGGAAMLRAAVEATAAAASELGQVRPKIIGVTVLTSLNDDDLTAVGQRRPAGEQSRRLAALAQECGLDGVVCSPHEIAALRVDSGAGFTLVVPGIRPSWAAAGDQKRVMTPGEAARLGADFLVIGRPITGA
ncbi:MAG: orotidine-5'-phosphate decarboxylase, partial [Dongiaceae bacterium]